MTQTIQNPLSADQNVRAAAVSLAAEVTKGRSVSTDDVLDLAEFIVGPEPCPLATLFDAITFDRDLGEAPAKPAEPEVYTVHDEEGVEALPIGSVVLHPAAGWRYVRRPKGWTSMVAEYDHYPSIRLVYPTGLIVDYIPGGA